MAVKLRRGLFLQRPDPQPPAPIPRPESPVRIQATDVRIIPARPEFPNRIRRPPQPSLRRGPATLQIPQQEIASRSLRLDHAPPPPIPGQTLQIVAGPRRRTQRGGVGAGDSKVPPLRGGENPAVADGAHGAEDAVQRVRGQVQVGSACTRVPTRREPHLRVDAALQLPPQGAGAQAAEGAAESGAGAAATALPPFHHRRTQRPR